MSKVCRRCRIESVVAFDGMLTGGDSYCRECAEDIEEQEHDRVMDEAEQGWDHD